MYNNDDKELKEMLIVIADDDPDDITFVVDALKDNKINCKVIAVKNGLELVNLLLRRGDERLQDYTPDLIILDINMHVLNGLEALEVVRSHKELQDLPVYILSTSVRPDHLEKANQLGAKKYYKKPPQYADLRALIKEVCEDALQQSD